MENSALKIKLAVLWLSLAELLSVAAFFASSGLYPELTEQMIAEGEGFGLISSLFWLIILAMAFLSLTLKDSTNRRANIIAGIVFAAFLIIGLGDDLRLGRPTLSLIDASMVVVAVLIVWLAWKWPKQEVAPKG